MSVNSIFEAQQKANWAEKQRKYAAAKPSNVTPSRTHVNNTTTSLYTGSGMTPTRAGADDHKQHSSLGLRAQIKVRTV